MAARKKEIKVRQWVLLLCASVILLSVMGGTYAYITARTQQIDNQFVPVKVTCQVEEKFDGNVKQDVRIRNTGDIPGFIRAMVVVTWVGSDGKVLSAAPEEGEDYTVQWGGGLWVKGDDGFWYYTAAVNANDTTSQLIQTLTPGTAPNGYQLQVQILATAIQADPPEAAETAWGIEVEGSMLIPTR